MNQVIGTPARSGPEAKLVEAFIDSTLSEAIKKGEHRLVFVEPKLGSSTPDIVIVFWSPAVTRDWPESRLLLKPIDLRLAQLLFTSGPCAEEELRALFPRKLAQSLKRLESAKVINHSQKLWALNDMTDIFAVYRIVTFEAKISWMSKALEQAHLNTWFASESYILTGTKYPREQTLNRAKEQGVGIWSVDGETINEPLVKALELSIPQSYVSWLFNEFAWRTSLGVS